MCVGAQSNLTLNTRTQKRGYPLAELEPDPAFTPEQSAVWDDTLEGVPGGHFFANDLPNLYSYCRTRVHLRTQELLMNSEDVGKKTRAPLTPPKRRGSHATGRAAP